MIKKPDYLGFKIPFALTIITLLTLSYLSYTRIHNLIEEASLVNHANLIKFSLEKTLATLSEKESNMRIYWLSNDSVYLSLYVAADSSLNFEYNKLLLLIGNDSQQQQNAFALRTAIDSRIEMMEYNNALFQASKVSLADRLKGNALMDDVRSLVAKMEAEEDKILITRSAAFSRSAFATPLFAVLLIIGSITILVASYLKISKQQKESSTLTSKAVIRSAELVIANQELESFNYISSHDLQEPLRKIQVFASRLIADESQNLSAKGKDYVFRMQDAANRMQALIADLLAYARTTSSERKFEITDLNTVLVSVKRDLADILAEKNAIIEVAEMCHARVIPFQFHQLLENIIGNALKFAKSDLPPHIVIRSRIIKGSEWNSLKLLPEKEYCHITIADNGIGFEPQYKDHIFQLFKRLHDKEKIKGTGIGLSIVKKIVDNHSGLIIATSELNKGATFDIYIPTNLGNRSLSDPQI
jgi:signal transduction histidine kinase